MSWAIGFDPHWKRDIGYDVPATCDHPGCEEEIDRGLGYVCGGEPYGGEHGCGLYFCGAHLFVGRKGCRCLRCSHGLEGPFEAKPDRPLWLRWKLRDETWRLWREENPDEVKRIRATLRDAALTKTRHSGFRVSDKEK